MVLQMADSYECRSCQRCYWLETSQTLILLVRASSQAFWGDLGSLQGTT